MKYDNGAPNYEQWSLFMKTVAKKGDWKIHQFEILAANGMTSMTKDEARAYTQQSPPCFKPWWDFLSISPINKSKECETMRNVVGKFISDANESGFSMFEMYSLLQK